ncbi:HD domain-containing protein [Paenibacillus dokdonensis]|uniref:HD domain-containing protein n=1 Tax=Paenibacillus dokdonensis TaxID=2567944 RepID=A0ABU6GJX7_9BACL|nr:HD domain-containing protein [Paenibacillus dokdonensis]MEC0238541.1 HD domain-containing protein [Paenibacillus dokdonensis]
MTKHSEFIQQAEQFVKRELSGEASGHDWWHIERVRNTALEIAGKEQADPVVCELAALLHDVADEKLNDSKEAGLDKVRSWMLGHTTDLDLIDQVMDIISTMSYNGGKNPPMKTLEGQVVQDADRLDALGAVGIARTFVYSGAKGRIIHDPGLSEEILAQEDYRSSNKTAIYHFYEKLLKLKDLMNTSYARELAEQRHAFMELYLKQFYSEWKVRD